MFTGFSPETIDFLWGLRMNNNREWFTEHKQQYLDTLFEPMKALAKEISEPFMEIPGFVCKTSRIYRDMRMHPPTPYKESLWTCIRHDGTWWLEEPSLFFEIRPDGCSYGFLFWKPSVPTMNALRADMTVRPQPFLTMLSKAERGSGLTVTGEAYKKKKPCDNKKLEPYVSLRNLYAIGELPPGELMFSPALATTVRDAFRALYPLVEYCRRFTAAEKKE
ncbi:MAG: DUF2461 domain-containing protein [Oscillospiraceae bacterium]|nr:DUF2461 domain-containing protein [Oscillospiraceae bacterium]